jgi:EAL domain-containing protein (putative c-di-GMP-specific phosphodiesterase class I)/GGDEF domain-containing protein
MPTTQRPGIQGLTEYLATVRAAAPDASDVVMVVRFAELDRVTCLLGHDYAQRLTDAFAQRLGTQLRDKDVVCALSERDLGVVLPGLSSPSVTLLAAHKIRRIIEGYCREVQHSHPIKTHVGMSRVAGGDPNVQEFIRHAYIAMLKAERNDVEFLEYSSDDGRDIHRELEIEEELKASAGDYPFELYYQPQLDLHANVVTSAEVLLRWNSHKLGYVPPNVFVPIAERKGMINGITEWVIQKSLYALEHLSGAESSFNLAINVSPINLRDPALPQFIEECLDIWTVPPSGITLELTEGAMIDDPKQALARLNELKRLGVKLSIDDFGTGYSSLQYLSGLPVDEVKIDQSFIRTLMESEHNRRIVNAVVDLARNFSLEVVAEGVEDEASLAYLRDIGCHKAQGYFISRPAPEEAFLKFLADFKVY